MKIFVDSANLLEIEEALERGFPSGITTNPSILAKEEKADFRERSVPCEIIVGSIRHIADISESFQAGADIVTVPPKFFRAMVSHPKTDEAVRQFVTDFQKWMQ